jgi:Cof subfamily protein (haloacid dehalogenase superfamily)
MTREAGQTRTGKIALLIADVDGTLVTDDKQLTPEAVAAVKRLDKAGVAFTVTSSRPPRGLAMLTAPLNLRLPLGGFNGGGLVHPDLSPISDLRLAPDVARETVAVIQRHGMDAWVYNDDSWFVRDAAAPHVAREQFTLGFAPTVVAAFEGVLGNVGKIVAVGDDPPTVARCGDMLNATLGNRASATRSQSFFIDITHPEANKGTLVQTLSRMLSIPPVEIATIGDGENDTLMFAKSGLSIAMGNAGPNVKTAAQFVTESNRDNGFARAVDRFVLGSAS